MTCPGCRRDNPAGSRFCLECGGRLPGVCPSCRVELPDGAKFCNRCGAPVAGPPTAPAPPRAPAPRFGSPEAYTPRHLADRILTARASLEGERKQVTVLFADMKGSMELLADRDPEEARTLIDPVLELMMEAVHRYEGTVNQVMGDGVMALFGAPLAHEDHGVRACYAALRMQEGIARYASEIQRTHGVPVQIRIGLNAGEVVVRSIGNDLRMDYTAVGQTTHLAARMEQMARPGSILITQAMLRLVEDYVAVKPLGAVTVKGLTRPAEVYELIGPGAARTRLEAAARRGLSRFVGRDPEMGRLRQALDLAAGGHGQIVGVVGEAGIGKSRLYYEFVRSHRIDGWLLLAPGSVSYGRATPYLPLIDLLRAYFKIEERDDHRTIREKLAGRLLTLDESLRSLTPALLTLLDVPVEAPGWHALDPPQRRRFILDAIRSLLVTESRRQPLCLMLEDLHWIDSETQAFLDGFVDALPGTRILLLVNYRPEYRHAWADRPYYAQLRIDPLPPESADVLLDALVGRDPELAPLKRVLTARTDGNPFFLEESVRTLLETGVLVAEGGGHRMTRPVDAIRVPSTVQAVLAARIDRLAPEDKAIVQSAAVVGKDVPVALLQAVVGQPAAALHDPLRRLQSAGFLDETRLYPELEYTFKHALTHEVAYDSVLHERRRALHAEVVAALEAGDRARRSESVELLAHHAFRGEVWAVAAAALREAGQKALLRSANEPARRAFEQALVALDRLPEGRERSEQRLDVCIDLRSCLVPLGEQGTVFRYLDEAEHVADALGDGRRLAGILALKGFQLWLTGRSQEAVEPGRRTLRLAEQLGDASAEILAHCLLGQAYHDLGRYQASIETFCRSLELLRGREQERFPGLVILPSVLSRTWLAWSLADVGRFDEATRHAEEGMRIARDADAVFSRASATFARGLVAVTRGDLAEGTGMLEETEQLCREWQFNVWLPPVLALLGHADAVQGRTREGIARLEQAVGQAPGRNEIGHALWLALLAEAYLLAGRRDEAGQAAARARDVARARQARGDEAWAARVQADLLLDDGPSGAERAEAAYHEALRLASETGRRPVIADCHVGLGRVLRRGGLHAAADGHFAAALDAHRDMDTRFWRARVEGLMDMGDSERPPSPLPTAPPRKPPAPRDHPSSAHDLRTQDRGGGTG
jgi:class 3 adenylate cyclase/tetratricopeptide (TPR) repeat protein